MKLIKDSHIALQQEKLLCFKKLIKDSDKGLLCKHNLIIWYFIDLI